ncbi:hypothetical protein Dimus_014465 [Dionaea muscipula]
MDLPDTTRAVLERIQKIEPENASKILGLLMKDYSDRELIRLSFGPDKLIEDAVQEAKFVLASAPPRSSQVNGARNSDLPQQFPQFQHPLSRTNTSRVPATSYWDTQIPAEPIIHSRYADSVEDDDYWLQQHIQFLNYEDQLNSLNTARRGGYPAADYYCPEASLGNLNTRTSRMSPSSLPEYPMKTCEYYSRGYCKRGSSCRYLHGHSSSIMDNFTQTCGGSNSNEFGFDDHLFSHGSLEKLELEITEILKSRRGNPVSIASLPMMYYENYGKTLQAEGYLTESQRHGRAGYSLTKLLARLGSIRLIDRPHGQHSVILAEDAAKYNLEKHTERKDPGQIVNGSKQIYLTFPAESTFTEDDVSNYFSSFGQVEDVRIPCQQKRMFGFVTFSSANTVKIVLSKGNPHFVCGARVLVKPYREKSKPTDRKCMDKNEHHYCFWEADHDYHLSKQRLPRGWEAPRFWRRYLMEEQETLERLMRLRLEELQLSRKAIANQIQPYIGHSMEELYAIKDHSSNYTVVNDLMINLLNNCSVSDRPRHPAANYSDQER